MNEPILRFMKKEERTTNKMTNPKVVVEKFGKEYIRKYILISLIPIKKRG